MVAISQLLGALSDSKYIADTTTPAVEKCVIVCLNFWVAAKFMNRGRKLKDSGKELST